MDTSPNADNIQFRCEGKCRICPYPGANCKTFGADAPGREEDPDHLYMNEELKKSIMRQYHIM